MIGIHSTRVLIDNQLVECTILVDQGKILSIVKGQGSVPQSSIIDHGNLMVMPGIIDPHVHINEPGRTQWEGFDTATKAAAAGGVTTVVDMPLNSSPVTTSSTAFNAKLESAHQNLHINCGFWGGLIPSNAHDLNDILESGVLGIKAFLTHSGIDEFPNVTEKDLHAAMPQIARKQMPLLVHCELDHPHSGLDDLKVNPHSYAAYLNSRPKSWENEAIELVIRLGQKYNCPVHIVHLSSSDPIPLITEIKESGAQLTVETCPHYLTFQAENIPDGATQFKCAPPIREKINNDQLWRALGEGIIDFIATDHSPSPFEMKKGDFQQAWGGISSLQHALPAIWTAARSYGLDLIKVSALLSTNAAHFLNLQENKGRIREGYDADLVVWDPESSITVDKDQLQYRHKMSPYVGQKLLGKVCQTYVGGNLVYDQGDFINLNKGKVISKHHE